MVLNSDRLRGVHNAKSIATLAHDFMKTIETQYGLRSQVRFARGIRAWESSTGGCIHRARVHWFGHTGRLLSSPIESSKRTLRDQTKLLLTVSSHVANVCNLRSAEPFAAPKVLPTKQLVMQIGRA